MSTNLYLRRFSDPVYYLYRPFTWLHQKAGDSEVTEIHIPAGFVVTFDSIPKSAWILLQGDPAATKALVIHEYLYWTQSMSRAEADEIFRLTLEGTTNKTLTPTLLSAVKLLEQPSWDKYKTLKSQGERRTLKNLPTDPKAKWSDIKNQQKLFVE
jgi:hypothetical protein